MSRYLLDNGVLVAYLKGRPGALRLVRPWILAREAATSHLIYGEAAEYLKSDQAYRRRRSELRALQKGARKPSVLSRGMNGPLAVRSVLFCALLKTWIINTNDTTST